MAKTLIPWSATSAAAAASVVDSGLEAQRTRSAPPALRVMARLAVSVVTCRQAASRWPLSGCSRLKRSRICCRTGISCAAHSIIRRPSSASFRSLMSYRCAGMVAIPLPRPRAIERNHVHKRTQPALDLGHVGPGDAEHAEVFNRQRAQHAAVEHAAPQDVIPVMTRARDRAQQATGEGVAGTSRIAHGLERVGRRQEDPIPGKEEGAVLAALDDHDPRPVGEDVARGRGEEPLARELDGLLVVDENAIDAPEHALEARPGGVEPELDRVAGDEIRLLDLVEDVELQLRLDVGEEDDARAAVGGRQHRVEPRKDVELGLERLALLEPYARVASRPAKGLALKDLETAQIDVARFEEGAIRRREIVTDHGNQPNRGEDRPGDAEVASPAAEHIGGAFRRRVDGIERDGADDEDRADGIGHLELQVGHDVVFGEVVGPFEKFELDQEGDPHDPTAQLLDE